ncbi:MAG: type IV pilus twitching motility protein PilT [Planctomycetota bacterium]
MRGDAEKRRVGELLIAERYLTAEVLEELLDTQRRARRLREVLGRKQEDMQVKSPLLLDYLSFTRRVGAQELLLVPGRPPAVRVADDLMVLNEDPLTNERLREMLREAFEDEEVAEALRGKAATKLLDHRFGLFRGLLSAADHGLVLTCRPLSLELAESDLRLPRSLAELARIERGLVVIAGSRYSTRANVLAQLVDLMNDERPCHIITIERLLTYLHESRTAKIAQREVGNHTRSYRTALKSALRQDPDVLVVSEIDDAEAIATTVLAAETGCLVLCSLHATDPSLAIRRLVDVQAQSRRNLVRATIANCIRAIAVLDVVPGIEAGERYLVSDLVPASAAVTRLIRDDRLHQLRAVASRETGVVSRDDLILKLYSVGRISKAVALERLNDPIKLEDAAPPRKGRR